MKTSQKYMPTERIVKNSEGASLAAQQLRPQVPNEGCMGPTSGRRTKISHATERGQ